DHQRQERPGVRAVAVLRHPDGAGRRDDVGRGPVQLRVLRPGPPGHHLQGHAGGAQRRPADLRRPPGGHRVVGGPAGRRAPGRPARPRHAAGPHHRRGVHDGLRRPRLRHRPALRGGAGLGRRRPGQRAAGRPERRRRGAGQLPEV
ncbi:MAG: DUF124 domain-containing protein, partial [uncultured Actinomycetospora sp.]